MKKISILILEDSIEWSHLLAYHLKKFSINFFIATNNNEAKKILRNNLIHLALIDRILLDKSHKEMEDGLNLVHWIKKHEQYADIKIAILSVCNSPEEKIAGYNAHIDEYITKETDMQEIVARLSNLIYKSSWHGRQQIQITKHVALDLTSHYLIIDNEVHPISVTLITILEYLHQHKNTAVSRRQLLQQLDSRHPTYMRTIDAHIARIRKILGIHKDILQTVTHKGYMLKI